MAERRMLRKDLCDSDAFNVLTMPAQILYMMLILHADDEGCFRADAKYWSRTVFYTKRQGPIRVERMLDELLEAKLIIVGQTKHGPAGHILGWFSMQTLTANRSKPSKFFEVLTKHGLTPRWGVADEDKVIEAKRSEEEASEANSGQTTDFRRIAGDALNQTLAKIQAEKDGLAHRMDMHGALNS